MSRVICVGDVHLKPVIFDKVDKILASEQADFAVFLGDLVDDWGEEFNPSLCQRTLERAIKFYEDHPETLFCTGNHDFGYLHTSYGPLESGHSKIVESVATPLLEKLPQQIMHIVDGVIFTHAGLTEEWVERQKLLVGYNMNDYGPFEKPDLERLVNYAAPDELWQENSPIWARPQQTEYEMYPAKLQVVGHTPVKTITFEHGVLSVDTHSTYRNGAPFGDRSFAIVDTKKGTWEYAKEEEV